jgi:hypothetical protein
MDKTIKLVNGVQHKQCGQCTKFKPIHGFNKRSWSMGASRRCSMCYNVRNKEYKRAQRGGPVGRWNDFYINAATKPRKEDAPHGT